jgi:hypothetical protein
VRRRDMKKRSSPVKFGQVKESPKNGSKKRRRSMNSVRVLTISEDNIISALDTYLQTMSLLMHDETITRLDTVTIVKEVEPDIFQPASEYRVTIKKEVSN